LQHQTNSEEKKLSTIKKEKQRKYVQWSLTFFLRQLLSSSSSPKIKSSTLAALALTLFFKATVGDRRTESSFAILHKQQLPTTVFWQKRGVR
jgi:hypothetical protein